MNLINLAKRIKNRYKIINIFWNWFKKAADVIFFRGIKTYIGGFGPFRMVFSYAFSDIVKNWGGKHNRGFHKWVEYCRGKAEIFDVGAHIGLYALPAGKVIGNMGKLYAFEPAAANYRILKKQISFNKISNIELYPYIVGKRDEENVLFYEQKISSGSN